MAKKELRFSLKTIYIYSALCAFIAVLILYSLFADDGFKRNFDVGDIVCFCIVIGVPVVMLYQRKNNILYYDENGFSVNGQTYAFSEVTELKAFRGGRYGMYYHIYIGEEIVFKFSIAYDNKDDFICLLQDNGVRINV